MTYMPIDALALRNYFSKLGLDPEIADLYLTLHAYGPQTISGLARLSGIERTRVYRLLEKMTSANLVEAETQYKRVILHAAPITNLEILLAQQEQRIRDLQNELTHFHSKLTNSPINHATRVHYYRGQEGNRQMFWNQTKAQGETLAILYEPMQSKTGLAFFERWVRKFNERGLKARGLVGDHFLESLQQWYNKHDNERMQHWESRYLPPEVLPITHSTITYDDVLAYYNWRDGEIFGVEIYNPEIAKAHRHTFELLWGRAIPITDDLNWQPSKQQ
jgi:sugar-specific transcriptional regulator TrmB